jgi:diguanylate cyclase (GGDEF)-like protein
MHEFTLLAVILVLSVALQTAAAFIALVQVRKVEDRYRKAWLIVALALVLMVERRMVPLWLHISVGEVRSMMDSLFGLAISVLMVVGVYGLTELLTGLKLNANTDELTGLQNRRAVLSSLCNEIERAKRTNRPIAILMYDLDHFKGVNDTYGHVAGDIVLQSIASIALSTFRKIDAVGRIGGEEFLVVMPESDQDAARAAAERFRVAVAEHKFAAGSHRIESTVSIGVFVPDMETNSVTVQSVLEATDKALYAAKNAGRNCIVVQNSSSLKGH